MTDDTNWEVDSKDKVMHTEQRRKVGCQAKAIPVTDEERAGRFLQMD